MEEFKNLYEFYNYKEFCPICNKRTIAGTVAPSPSSSYQLKLDGKYLYIFAYKRISINLLDNTISDLINIRQLVIRQYCNKYHFFYSGIINFSEQGFVKSIRLDRYHFIWMSDTAHYTINNSFIDNYSNVRITTKDYKMIELQVPLIRFDSLSKKKIDVKLENIQLLY